MVCRSFEGVCNLTERLIWTSHEEVKSSVGPPSKAGPGCGGSKAGQEGTMCCQPRAAASLVLHSRASILGRRERATVAPTQEMPTSSSSAGHALCRSCPPDLLPREDATLYTTYDTFDIATNPLGSSLATRFSNNPAYFYALSVSSLLCNHLACSSAHILEPIHFGTVRQPRRVFLAVNELSSAFVTIEAGQRTRVCPALARRFRSYPNRSILLVRKSDCLRASGSSLFRGASRGEEY
ncbi:hypothetical protein IWZ03DRAFT_75035 [Phyllosticta citriasiana]|uniref:Uncharacterized protein n=1 Tax=Phyllosticta citriasiana TaxID=595635 RepID=A0ABR1K938_9PEZI